MSRTYLALLRGINVGGANIVPMADLRACIQELGAVDVATYIQSGNVLFGVPQDDDEDKDDPETWTRRIEAALSARFGYDATATLRTHAELRAIVKGAPQDFGSDPDGYRSDVLFLMDREAIAADLVKDVLTRDGVDTAAPGPSVIYFERLAARASQSHLTKIVGTPLYKRLTIRNWRTTTRLLERMEERAT